MTLYINNKKYDSVDDTTKVAIIDGMKKAGVVVNHQDGLMSVLKFLIEDETDHRFDSIQMLVDKLKTLRANYFFNKGDENNNLAPVSFESLSPVSSVGWENKDFFAQLGSATSRVGSYRRDAEQEYILQSIAKGPLFEAAEIATRYGVGIAVRPTGLLAHMGIESGSPTKAQEFKNKTSKEIDLFLCPELMPKDIGAVVHFDPRCGWSSRKANMHAWFFRSPVFNHQPNKSEWELKKPQIIVRAKQLGKKYEDMLNDKFWEKLESSFFSRAKEYVEEDTEYRHGHYAAYTKLEGPLLRLKLRPEENMYGDHDLFGFTSPDVYGIFILATDYRVPNTQYALQMANAFQAQHGGIWYWEPSTEFNVGIKNKIMGAHSPPGDEPLIHIRPNNEVTVAFFMPNKPDKGGSLQSVWDCPSSERTEWLKTTWSGKKLLELYKLWGY